MNPNDIEKEILENKLFKEAINKLSEQEKQETLKQIKNIVHEFYENILVPLDKL